MLKIRQFCHNCWLVKTHPQTRISVYHISENGENEVSVDVTLLNLVNDDVRDAAKASLKFPQENSNGAEHHYKAKINNTVILKQKIKSPICRYIVILRLS